MDTLNFSQVYYYIGFLRGRLLVRKDKELLRDLNRIESTLDHALGYDKLDKKEATK